MCSISRTEWSPRPPELRVEQQISLPRASTATAQQPRATFKRKWRTTQTPVCVFIHGFIFFGQLENWKGGQLFKGCSEEKEERGESINRVVARRFSFRPICSGCFWKDTHLATVSGALKENKRDKQTAHKQTTKSSPYVPQLEKARAQQRRSNTDKNK